MSQLPVDNLDLYRVIAEDAFMGFVTFDIVSRQSTFINRRARELFELNEPLAQMTLDGLFATESRGDFKAFNEELVAHEGLYQDVLLTRSNGQFFVANVGVKKLEMNHQQLVLLMIQDVTLQKKLQREVASKQLEINAALEELIKQNKQLKELDIAKNRFIALTTHELRTPLSAMVASSEILHLQLYDTPEQMKEFIDMIYDQGLHLLDLVNDILDFAKIQANRMDFYIELQDPKELVDSIVNGFTNMANGQNITLRLVSSLVPLNCFFDDVRLRQVLSNIINNAIKYNRENGTVDIWYEDTTEAVKILVKDTGKGISPDQIEKVFNEFETLGNVATHHKGTGLGMPISRRLMEGMGGKLLVSSEVGVGSTFWVEIPKNKILSNDVYRPRPGGSTGDLAA